MKPFTEHFLATSLWPSVLLTVVVMFLGGLGNGLVVFIYRQQYNRSVPSMFIYILAVLDLLSCVISMPIELLILLTYSDFPSGFICQLGRYVTYIIHGNSCVLLMGIAFHRYEKVCRPNNQNMTLTRAKIFYIANIAFSLFSFIPCFFIYGEKKAFLLMKDGRVRYLPITLNVTAYGIQNDVSVGRFCSPVDSKANEVLVPCFYIFQFFLYAVLVALTIFFYTQVTRTMMRYKNKQQSRLFQLMAPSARLSNDNESSSVNKRSSDHNKENRLEKEPEDPQPQGDVSVGNTAVSPEENHADNGLNSNGQAADMNQPDSEHGADDKRMNDYNDDDKTDEIKEPEIERKIERKPTITFQCGRGKHPADKENTSDANLENSKSGLLRDPRKRRQSVQPIRTQRTSLMLFFISLSFILSFLPFWIIVFARYMVGSKFVPQMSSVEHAVVNIFIRFMFAKNLINPMIYSFMNKQFRARCSEIFGRNKRSIQIWS